MPQNTKWERRRNGRKTHQKKNRSKTHQIKKKKKKKKKNQKIRLTGEKPKQPIFQQTHGRRDPAVGLQTHGLLLSLFFDLSRFQPFFFFFLKTFPSLFNKWLQQGNGILQPFSSLVHHHSAAFCSPFFQGGRKDPRCDSNHSAALFLHRHSSKTTLTLIPQGSS
jgi:hypothetical protein